MAKERGVGAPGEAGRQRPPRLLFWHEIPPWQKDNEYILSGYRPTSGSAWISFLSLTYWNNQTINAYSHLIGALVFAALPAYFYKCVFELRPNGKTIDLVVVSIYCFGVAICFAFSATFHVLWNHSRECSSFCNKLDYLGILVLMWGAGIPTIYYGFLCDGRLQRMYWTTTSATALGCTYLTLNPQFASPQCRNWRASLYAGFGLASVIFVLHGLYLRGWEAQKIRMSLVYMMWMAMLNLLGAAIYAARIPERWVSYRFDMCGASHQIFHLAVVMAALIHFNGLQQSFQTLREGPDSDFAFLSSRLLPKTYGQFGHRTRINWDVHVVSVLQSILVNVLSLYVIIADGERQAWTADEDWHLRIWGYSGLAGLLQSLAVGYYLWDTYTCVRYAHIFGWGMVVHGLASSSMFIFGFHPFVHFYCPVFLLHELSTPFLNVHWFCDKLDLSGSTLQAIDGAILISVFFGRRIVWGAYGAVGVSRDVYRAIFTGYTLPPGKDHETALLGLRMEDSIGQTTAFIRTQRLPYWLGSTYVIANVALMLLNLFWFFKMVQAVRKRFAPTPRSESTVSQLKAD